MKQNNTEGLSPNDVPFAPSDSLAENIKTIQSYSSLEEDEEVMPVAQEEIERAIAVLEAIYVKKKLLPFSIVPTRSAGVGIEYKIKGVKVCYRFHTDGVIYFSVIKELKLIKQVTFTNPAEAPALIELV